MKGLFLIVIGLVCVTSSLFAGVEILNLSDLQQAHLNALNSALVNTTTSGINRDYAGRNNRNSVFGQAVIGQEISKFTQIFSYPFDTRLATTTSSTGGSVTQADSLLICSTSTNVLGSALFRTKRALQYVPGKEAYIKFTAIFSTPKINSRQEIGLFDELNGFSIGTTGTSFAVFRTRDSTVKDTILQANFNRDKLDGTGTSGFTLDITKGNIFRIAFGYLGFAPIYYEIFTPGKGWVLFHVIEYPNSNTETNCNLPYIKFTAKAQNFGNNTNIVLKTASVEAGIIDGSGSVAEKVFARSTSTSISSTTGSRLVVYHSKTTFGALANKVETKITHLTGAVEGTKPLTFMIYKLNSAPTGGSWTNQDTTNSSIEISYDTVVNFANVEPILNISLGKSSDFMYSVEDANIYILPDEYLLISYKTTANADIEFGTRWKEMF